MSVCELEIGAVTRCAYCGKPFAVVDGRLQRWRAPNGLLYCTEFCADDAEEAAFQNRRRSDVRIERGAQDYASISSEDSRTGRQ